MALTYQQVASYASKLLGSHQLAVSPANWGLLAASPVATATVPAHKKNIEFGISPNFSSATVTRNVLIFSDPIVTGDDIKAI